MARCRVRLRILTYTPNPDFNGADSFTFFVNDGTVDSNTATVTITVNAVNDAPVAFDDAYATSEDVALSVPGPFGVGVLGNDTDVDGDPLSAVLVAGPAEGALTLNADGSFVYTPNADFNGSDSFTYVANDGTADSNVATVTIDVAPVNDAPVAADDAYSVDEDAVLNVAAPGVLGNDTDVDGDALSAVLVAGPSNGALALNTDGSFGYTPNNGFGGSDSFTYVANDGAADSNVATVTIDVAPVNDAPVAADDAYSVDEDAVLNVAAPGVLANDTDVDGDALSAVLVAGPSNGVLALNADGSFVYTPNADFNGSDSFTYVANDGVDDSNIATVTITVNASNDAPLAVGDSYVTDEDTPLNVAAPGVLGNDTDVDGDSLTAVLDTNVANGTLTLNPDGSFDYTPNTGFTGTDMFSYFANDGTTNSNVSANVAIEVRPAAEPVVTISQLRVPKKVGLSERHTERTKKVVVVMDLEGLPVGDSLPVDVDLYKNGVEVDTANVTLVSGEGAVQVRFEVTLTQDDEGLVLWNAMVYADGVLLTTAEATTEVTFRASRK